MARTVFRTAAGSRTGRNPTAGDQVLIMTLFLPSPGADIDWQNPVVKS